MSGITLPDTTDSHKPFQASIINSFVSFDIGFTVNITPDIWLSTIFCTITATLNLSKFILCFFQ